MAKQRLALLKTEDQSLLKSLVDTTPTAPVEVVDEKPGTVTGFDKFKAYWHSAIAVIGFLLVGLTSAQDQLPSSMKTVVVSIIGVLTVVSIALKANEVWINKLGNSDNVNGE